MAVAVRNQAVDLARGLLIFYVVFIIHGLIWLKLLPENLSSILLFEMPCIFLISGYSYYLYESSSKYINPTLTLSSYVNFLTRRLSRLLIPYYAYALVCLVICLILKKPDWQIIDIVLAWLNPLEFGGNYSLGMLNWHLWFIAPFIAVTALLPFISKCKVTDQIPILGYVLIASLFMYLLSLVSFQGAELIKNIFYYSTWATFGYFFAKHKAKNLPFTPIAYLLVFFFAVLILVISQTGMSPVDLNMQNNKFPPNLIFFIFNCAWLSILLISTNYIKPSWIENALKMNLIQFFMTSGFSIYLWQGLGYTLASFINKKFDVNILLIWFLAFALSVIMGILFSPLERLKINFLTLKKQRSHL